MHELSVNRAADGRPEFMVALGLKPPYSQNDVKQAYLQRAKQLHPDHGGSAAQFHALHEAFERAQQYVMFRGDRLGWIAAKMSGYVATQQAIEQLQVLGADVVTHTFDWLKQSFGDFAQMTETVQSVRLVDSPRGDELVRVLAEQRPSLTGLAVLELPGCHISDSSLPLLAVHRELKRLDLSRTPVKAGVAELVAALPNLQSVELHGTSAGWLAKLRLRWRLRRRRRLAR